jgi:hypothetical protein
VTAQNHLHVLVKDEPGPDQPAVAKHEREQPYNPPHRRLVGEDDLEMSKVDLSLIPWRRLEADLEGWQWRWPQIARSKSVIAV